MNLMDLMTGGHGHLLTGVARALTSDRGKALTVSTADDGDAHCVHHPDGKPRSILLPSRATLESRGYKETQVQGLMDHEVGHSIFSSHPGDTFVRDAQHSPRLGHVANILEDAWSEEKMARIYRGSQENLGALRDRGETILKEKLIEAATLAPDSEETLVRALAYPLLGYARETPEAWASATRHALIEGGVDEGVVEQIMRQMAPAYQLARGYTKSQSSKDNADLAYRLDRMMWRKPDDPPPPPKGPGKGEGPAGTGTDGEPADGDDEAEGDSHKPGDTELDSGTGGDGVGAEAKKSDKGKPKDGKAPHKPEELKFEAGKPVSKDGAITAADLLEGSMRKDGIFDEVEAKMDELRREGGKSGITTPIYPINAEGVINTMGPGVCAEEWANNYRGKSTMEGYLPRFTASFKKLTDSVASEVASVRSALRIKLLSEGKSKRTRHQDRGDLDGASLHKLAARTSDKVFQRITPGITRKTNVTILADCSGSMGEDGAAAARRASLVLASALDGMPGVKTEVLGFSSTGGFVEPDSYRGNHLLHLIFKGFNERRLDKLIYMDPRLVSYAQNFDGEALRWATRRTLAQRADRRVIMVISDGAPAGGVNERAMLGTTVERADCYETGKGGKRSKAGKYSWLGTDLLHAVQAAEKHKVECIGIGISGSPVSSYYQKSVNLGHAGQLSAEVINQIKSLL